MELRTAPKPRCPECGQPGDALHPPRADHLYGVPGTWGFRGCERCGLAWLDPAPVPEDLHRAYASYYTHQPSKVELGRVQRAYLERVYGYPARGVPGWVRLAERVRHATRPGARAQCDFVAKHLRAPAPGRNRLLDVGCGDGSGAAFLALLGWTVQGVEPDPQAAEAARQRGVPVRTGFLEDPKFPEASFDAVVLTHVLEHAPDPLALLRECRRVLAPQGTLVAITPNLRSLGHRTFGGNWVHLDPPRHLVLFQPEALARTARRAGFGAAEVRSTVREADLSWLASHRIAQGPAKSLGWPPAPPSRWEDAQARRFLAQAARALRRDPLAGEELVLLARPGRA